MPRKTILLLAAGALCASVSWGHADVVISTGATHNMSCSGGVCAPTATSAVLNVGDLESLLAAGAVKVTTTGAGAQANSIRIRAKFSWSTTNTLALDAFKSVTVEQPVTVSGAGGVTVTINDGSYGGEGGEFSFAAPGSMVFANPASSLVINGATYTLETSIANLATAIAGNRSGNYALANNYDATGDGTYTTPPVATDFTGNFNGLGNTISNLTINDPTENAYVGLFAEISDNATLSNIRLGNANIIGGSGTSLQSSTECIGALVGLANEEGTIANAFASGTVSGGIYAPIGGLAGAVTGTVQNSGSAMSVAGGTAGAPAGGLVGVANGVSHSYATGAVSGSQSVGGLVGLNFSNTLSHSWASGAVSATDNETWAGGLVGINQGTVEDSSASGTVTCQFTCGGLVGIDDFVPNILRSFASGDVTSKERAGGLVGNGQITTISDSYAVGAVSAPTAGGLVGEGGESGNIARSYSSGSVTGSAGSTGGLIGYDEPFNTRKHTYWDLTTSGITNKSQGAGNIANDPGIKGLSNTKLQSGLPKGFSPHIWAENPKINNGLPYLIANPPAK